LVCFRNIANLICSPQISVRNQFQQTIASAPNIVLHPFHAREEQTQRGHVFDDSMKTDFCGEHALRKTIAEKSVHDSINIEVLDICLLLWTTSQSVLHFLQFTELQNFEQCSMVFVTSRKPILRIQDLIFLTKISSQLQEHQINF